MRLNDAALSALFVIMARGFLGGSSKSNFGNSHVIFVQFGVMRPAPNRG
jgi:hypothetical protein